jgi:hypothetical protein
MGRVVLQPGTPRWKIAPVNGSALVASRRYRAVAGRLAATRSPKSFDNAITSGCLIDCFDLFCPWPAHFFSILQFAAFAVMIFQIVVVVLRATCRVAADEERPGIPG